MKFILLVDVDGTVLDKEKMWQQMEERFQQSFPGLMDNFRQYYDLNKGEDHLVEKALKVLQKDYGILEEKFRSVFEEVDYGLCFDHDGWQRLHQESKKHGVELAFFTQGTEWVQNFKRKQLEKIVGNVPWHIYEDNKMDHLGELMSESIKQGRRIIGLIDDLEDNLKRAKNECDLGVLSSRVADVILPSEILNLDR